MSLDKEFDNLRESTNRKREQDLLIGIMIGITVACAIFLPQQLGKEIVR